MPVAEGVDVQYVDVRGHNQRVLWEGSKHVPWVQVHKRSQEVQSQSSSYSDENDTGAAFREEGPEELIRALVNCDLRRRRIYECIDNQVD